MEQSKLWNQKIIWSTSPPDEGANLQIPLKLHDEITQHGCINTQEKVKGKTFFSYKPYLATLLHIRPPQCLSVLQQWQHCQKTQKQAVRYHCRSHGNRPAEGVPAPTLICTNKMQAYSPACYANPERRVGECSPHTRPTPASSSKNQGLMQNPAISVSDLLALLVKSATRGKRIKIPETLGLQCSFAHFLPLIKTTHSQRLEQSCSPKPVTPAEDKGGGGGSYAAESTGKIINK